MARQVRRISDLPAAGPLAGDELLEIVQNGDNKRVTVGDLPGGGGGGAVQSVQGRTGAVVITAADVGLGNADNTSDADKPVSVAQQAALDEKEQLLVAGTNITIDRTDPSNPVISAAGGGGTTGGWDTLATPAISAGVLTLDLSEPTLFAVGLDQNVTDLSFANLPSGKAPAFAVAFTQDATGGRTVAWPASVIGTPPDIGADPGGVTVVSLAYIGGGQYVISGAIYA